ncbi:uncharacterized protein LOC132260896 [Phlebotomus argentipes]|uniref:uncharacterized protein LOC132260896 n=1 Tax=Phlebotomus argentipes TaxID=94469 RepID=UPI002893647D|nr:uncharacterized protein LOC132260896 [Phlebotomus argentipes]
MAAVARHFTVWKTGQHFSSTLEARWFGVSSVNYRTKPSREPKKPKKKLQTGGQRIDSVAQSLASRGFLRSCQPYTPPHDVAAQIRNLGYAGTAVFSSLDDKFKFLEECRKIFNHQVPNSQLHKLKGVQDVIEFYETPVDSTLPLDTLKQEDLPVNLHIQSEFKRFLPDEDTMFGGVSAFPKSSTLVTGLTYRKKYRGHIAKRSWP